ncbi:hypothetical protein DFO67_102106 [Modicisalibacter xianhensis]|uniref:Uncharacterized protein n=1 Tax=Modicisalibacter xianhensis TaxID=442341 RepID=A0A4R8FYM3_9GAMM|nr:hypothetical protein [Halomonas xianhensis]TDX32157.1 hypothetical protein DFO67_102106 [Halomonas xianhensis]
MRDERPYPRELVQEWQKVIERASLTAQDAQWVMQKVHYALPPLCAVALQTTADFYRVDHGGCDSTAAVAALASQGLIEAQLPSDLGTLYPLYYAITHPRLLGRQTCRIASLGRRLISDWFSEVSGEVRTSRSNYYTHLLAVRHVLMAVIEAGVEPDADLSESPEAFFRSAIESDSFYSQRRTIQAAYDTFSEISSGNLCPGELIRSSRSGGSKVTRARRQKTDPWHEARVQAMVASPPPRRRAVTTVAEPGGSETPHALDDTETSALGFRHVATPSATADAEETSELPTLQRKVPSALTPGDDRRLVQRWVNSAATTALAAISDMARLTPEQVRDALRIALPPLERVFALLLLSTGLPVSRLLTLTVCQAGTTAQSPTSDDPPVWHPESRELCYRLRNGPSAREDAVDMQWVRLRLPAPLADALSDPEVATPGDRPFRGVRSRLNRRLARHFRHQPGITPTANRLSASSWLWRRPYARDDVAAATLSGQFSLALAAPAAYRQLSRHEIQRIFDATLESLGLVVTPEQMRDSSENHVSGLPDKSAVMGSAIAQPPEMFAALFTALREAMAAPAQEIASWWLGLPFPRESLAELYQYVAAYHLLAWQLSTGARPIGNSSHNRLGEHVQWIRDKASARGIESRVVPLLSEVHKELEQLRRWTESVQHQLQAQGLTLGDKRSGLRNTPAWLVAPQRGRRLVLRDMVWPDLQSLPLRHTTGLANNVARHSLASWLRACASDAEVDALLGHAHHGLSLSSPRAATAMGRQPELRRLLSQWLHCCGFRQLNWERLPWNR